MREREKKFVSKSGINLDSVRTVGTNGEKICQRCITNNDNNDKYGWIWSGPAAHKSRWPGAGAGATTATKQSKRG
jgi:hypothetical protein